jgi:ATP-dependent RNA helicase RhlE
LNFKDCNLIEPILKALDEQGYTEPTAIQAGAIRPALEGRDVLGIARTGTGKTCAFATPILQRLNSKSVEGRPIRALVLTPTRELAIQNQECFEAYSRYLKLRSVVIFGGVGQNPQVEAIQKGADILVATPGRLLDLMNQGHISLAKIEIFVLDEADRMLDMGFLPDVKRVIGKLPHRRQTLMFSATMPPEIEQLAGTMLKDPATVKVDPPTTTAEAVEQAVCLVDKGNKKHLLPRLLMAKEVKTALVFTRTKHGADKVVRDLDKAGIEAMAIHGNKSQNARQKALQGFKEGRLWVLVATDIAARGIDIEGLSHVINYDLPNEPETYIHRIGRTGRAGREGRAISLCCQEELPYLRDIQKLTGNMIPVLEHDWPMTELPEPPAPPPAPAQEKKKKPYYRRRR